jgi:hypothetical protein
MSLDDALALAGQVLADYEASALESACGAERIWAGRLSRALRDLTVAAVTWSAAPGEGPSAAALGAVVRQIEAGVVRLEAEAARLDRVTADLAAGRASGLPASRDRGRGALAWLGRRRVPGAVVLSAAEADAAWLAAADAAAWHDRYGDCADCVEIGACADPARHQAIMTQYAALRRRLGGRQNPSPGGT